MIIENVMLDFENLITILIRQISSSIFYYGYKINKAR